MVFINLNNIPKFNSLHYFSEVTKNLMNAPGSNLLCIWLFMMSYIKKKKIVI